MRTSIGDVAPEHPSQVDLLLAAEGELPEGQLRDVRRHLERCEQCQAAVREVDDSVAEYRDPLPLANPSEAPGPRWATFRRELERVAGRARTSSIGQPLFGRLAAVVPLLIAFGLYASYMPTVRASELIDRAAQLEQGQRIVVVTTRPAVEIRVRSVRSEKHTLSTTPQSDSDYVLRRDREMTTSIGTAQNAEERRAEELFDRGGLDWRAPLSVTSFRAWRNALTWKSDSVSESSGHISIETRAHEGAIRQGLLLLDGVTFEPTRIEWLMQNGTRVEISRASSPPPRLEHEPPKLMASASAAVAKAPALKADSDHTEIAVWATLHHHDADVTDDIRVSRMAGGRLSIQGVVPSRARRETLVRSLRTLPDTDVQLLSGDERDDRSTAPAGAPLLVIQGTARPALLTGWLEKRRDDPEMRRQFSADILKEARDLRAQALAWQRMEERYPAEKRARLSSEDRNTLLDVLADQRAQMTRGLQSLERQLAPVFADLIDATDASDVARPPSEAGVPTAIRIEQLVSDLLSDIDSADTPSHTDLRDVLITLRRECEELRQWLTSSLD